MTTMPEALTSFSDGDDLVVRLATAACLGRFTGTSRMHTESDLRFKPSTVSRRMAVVTGFYRTCVIDAVLDTPRPTTSAAPPCPPESPTLGLSHLQFEALLTVIGSTILVRVALPDDLLEPLRCRLVSAVQQIASVDDCVVIDCNEWIRLKWLGSPIGLTFISVLKRDLSLKLAIPEVLGGELDKHRAETARSMLRQLEDASTAINVVTGNPIAAGIITLTEVSIEVAIRERLSAIAEQTIYPDMNIDEVRRALARVNAEAPPNGPKNQQMKDSLLWEACVTLAKDYRVVFITSDNAFYSGRQPKNGLAQNLALEPSVKDGRLQVFSSLEDALQSFAPETSVTSSEIADIESKDLIAVQAGEAFARSPIAVDIRAEFKLRGVVPAYFRTEVPYVFAVSFTAFFYVNQNAEDRTRGEAAVSGECKLDTRQATIEAVTLRSIHWDLKDPGGREVRAHEVLGRVD